MRPRRAAPARRRAAAGARRRTARSSDEREQIAVAVDDLARDAGRARPPGDAGPPPGARSRARAARSGRRPAASSNAKNATSSAGDHERRARGGRAAPSSELDHLTLLGARRGRAFARAASASATRSCSVASSARELAVLVIEPLLHLRARPTAGSRRRPPGGAARPARGRGATSTSAERDAMRRDEPAAHHAHESPWIGDRVTSGRRTDGRTGAPRRAQCRGARRPPIGAARSRSDRSRRHALDDAQARAARARIARRSPPPSDGSGRDVSEPHLGRPAAGAAAAGPAGRGTTPPSGGTRPSRAGPRASGRRGSRGGRPGRSSCQPSARNAIERTQLVVDDDADRLERPRRRDADPGLPRPTTRATTSASCARGRRAAARGRSRARRRGRAAPRPARAMTDASACSSHVVDDGRRR